jgi:hypothetical protein
VALHGSNVLGDVFRIDVACSHCWLFWLGRQLVRFGVFFDVQLGVLFFLYVRWRKLLNQPGPLGSNAIASCRKAA